MNRGADPEHCITCSDSAVPMCVEVLLGDSGLAVCDGQTVDVTLVLPVRPGDVVLVQDRADVAVNAHSQARVEVRIDDHRREQVDELRILNRELVCCRPENIGAHESTSPADKFHDRRATCHRDCNRRDVWKNADSGHRCVTAPRGKR